VEDVAELLGGWSPNVYSPFSENDWVPELKESNHSFHIEMNYSAIYTVRTRAGSLSSKLTTYLISRFSEKRHPYIWASEYKGEATEA